MHSHLAQLDDQSLLTSTRRLAARSHELEADLLLHLGELDARGSYRELGFSSLFAFCMGELGFSEDAAYRRIEVARLVRRFESLESPLRKGRIHLTGLLLLAPRLTEENLDELVSACAGKTKEQMKEVLAARFPEPFVPDSIRKLPTPAAPARSIPPPTATLFSAPVPTTPAPPPPSTPARPPEPARKPKVEPLAPDAYLVQFTANKKVRDLLAQAKELFRHELPNGDLATLVEKAFELLVADKMKARFGVGARPRATSKTSPGKSPSRHVPMAKRRELACRGKLQCEFVGTDGRRCTETAGLEIDHVESFARTRDHASLRLLCRAHNQLEAEKLFGRNFMARKRAEAKATRASAGRAPAEEEVTRASAGRAPAQEESTRASAGRAPAQEESTRASAGGSSAHEESAEWPLWVGNQDQLSLI